MPVIINPYKQTPNPLGDALERAAKSMYGDTLTPALKREQLYGAQRENVETDNLMGAVATGGELDWSAIAPAIVGAGYDPSKFNDLVLGRSANMFGARDQRTQNAQVGAGKNFDATAEAFDVTDQTKRRGQDINSADSRYGTDVSNARQMYEFNNTPEKAMVGDEERFVRRSDVFGEDVAPILSQSEQKPAVKFNSYYDLYLNQNSMDPDLPSEQEKAAAKKYAMAQVSKSAGQKITVGDDGSVSIEQGGIGEATNNVKSNLQKQLIESQKFSQSVKLAKNFLTDPKHANLFGPVGAARQYAQGFVESVNTLGQALGYKDMPTAVAGYRQEAAKAGVASFIPELFDPNLDAVDTVYTVLLFQGAAALASQEGRSVSNEDITRMKTIFGDPKGFFASQRSLAAKLAIVERMADANEQVTRQALGGGSINGVSTDENLDKVGDGLTAETAIDIQSEAEADALPPGTWVRMNGRVGKVQ